MNKNQVSIIMKEKLNTAINEVCQNPWLFAINPGADFTRTRKMPIRELLRAIFGMRGNSLNKELYDYFKDRDEHITASAFVQQRAKLLPEVKHVNIFFRLSIMHVWTPRRIKATTYMLWMAPT